MTDKIPCVKCDQLAVPIKRTMLSDKHKGIAVVCIKCHHIEYIHTDEYKALIKLPVAERRIITND